MKKLYNYLSNRLVIFSLLIILQIVIFIFMIFIFGDYSKYFYVFCTLISIVVLLVIISNNTNPSYKIAWIVPILLFPILGGLFYLMFSINHTNSKVSLGISKMVNRLSLFCNRDKKILAELKSKDIVSYNQAYYIVNSMSFSIYNDSSIKYLKDGLSYYNELILAIKKAKKFVFLEYCIIEQGYMWNSILEVLKSKVKENVEVRIIYDDVGSIFSLPRNYDGYLRSLGIKCICFNRFVPFIRVRMNNRDHRKIAIIDGYIGFTGGINLADCYMNVKEKYGYWKDNGILLRGNAVYSLTLLFLSLWEYVTKKEEQYIKYYPSNYITINENESNYLIPYGTFPLLGLANGENIYLNLINKAIKYIYITTPYLVIDNEMITALINASKSGVDVRIIIPSIPDKKFVYQLSKSYYEVLISNNVKIYEYTPGFIHSKTFVVDDLYAVVGTINLDYRSLYLHFECACWIYKSNVIKDIKNDIKDVIKVSHCVSLKECKHKNIIIKLIRSILRLFAPLM